MPIKRKGMEISHISGQIISASSASGQHNTHKSNQQINVSIRFVPVNERFITMTQF